MKTICGQQTIQQDHHIKLAIGNAYLLLWDPVVCRYRAHVHVCVRMCVYVCVSTHTVIDLYSAMSAACRACRSSCDMLPDRVVRSMRRLYAS